MRSLEELFDLASAFAKGKIKYQSQDGKPQRLTIKQRQMWARIAAYIAQIMNTIADGIDVRQIDADLAKLEVLVDEATAKSKDAGSPETDRKEEPSSPASGQG